MYITPVFESNPYIFVRFSRLIDTGYDANMSLQGWRERKSPRYQQKREVMNMTKLEKLQKQLQDAKNLYETVGKECDGCAKAGARVQLKNAQRRSLSLSNRIIKLESAVRAEKNNQEGGQK